MRVSAFLQNSIVLLAGIAAALVSMAEPGYADPSKYPQFAQQTLPENITPAFSMASACARVTSALIVPPISLLPRPRIETGTAPALAVSPDGLTAAVGIDRGIQLVDVRTEEEYREVHILGAVSAPLAEFKDYLKSIPRDRPLVLY